MRTKAAAKKKINRIDLHDKFQTRENDYPNVNSRLFASILASVAAIGLASSADAQGLSTAADFDIAPQSLSTALLDFSKQAGVQILSATDIVNDLNAPRVRGTMKPVDALTQLLHGTQLQFHTIGDNAIAIDDGKSKSGADIASGAELDNFWNRFLLAQSDSSSSSTYPSSESGKAGQSTKEGRGEVERLEEVIVSAQRREQNLIDVPISISVLDGQVLDSATPDGLTDALRSVPGFDSNHGAVTAFYSLRGVSNASSAGGAGTVGFYLDGVPYGFIREAFYPNPNVYDLNRVEVLAGPQGTLYGANSLNGVIRVLTNNANADEFELKARTFVSSVEDGDQGAGADVAANVPIIEGRLGARFVASYSDLGGWTDSYYPDDYADPSLAGTVNRRDVNDTQRVDYRLKLHGEVSDTLSVDLSVWRSELERGRGDLSLDNRTMHDLIATPTSSEFTTYGVNIVKEFTNVTLSSQTSYIDYSTHATASGEPIDFPALLDNPYDTSVFAQEFNLVSDSDGPFEWSAGAFYRQADDSSFSTLTIPSIPLTLINNDFDDSSTSYAVFGEVSRDFADFNLAVGLRYFHDDETMTINKDYNGPDVDPPAGPDFVLAAGSSFDTESEALTPRVVLSWTPSEDLTAYASYSQGFRSGFSQAPNVQSQYPNFAGVEPDRLSNYEVGLKGRSSDRRFTYETALFFIDWQDAQQTLLVTLPSDLNASAVVNGNSISGIGASFAVTAQLFERMRVGLNASWNDLGFDSDVIDAGGALLFEEGDRPSVSPQWTAGAFVHYSWDLGGGFTASSSLASTFKSSQNTTTLAFGSEESDKILITDLRFSIEAPKNWTFSLFADNVADEDGRLSNYTPAVEWITHPRPRTIGLQIEYKY